MENLHSDFKGLKVEVLVNSCYWWHWYSFINLFAGMGNRISCLRKGELMIIMMLFLLFLTISLPRCITNSLYCVLHNFYDVSAENLELDQQIIPYVMSFVYSHHFSAWHCLKLLGEILPWSLKFEYSHYLFAGQCMNAIRRSYMWITVVLCGYLLLLTVLL